MWAGRRHRALRILLEPPGDSRAQVASPQGSFTLQGQHAPLWTPHGVSIIPILKLKQLRPGAFQKLAQRHTCSPWSVPGLRDPGLGWPRLKPGPQPRLCAETARESWS